MRQASFRCLGGPHDGETLQIAYPIPWLKKSLVLQTGGTLGILHQYRFDRKMRTATYEGVVRVRKDGEG